MRNCPRLLRLLRLLPLLPLLPIAAVMVLAGCGASSKPAGVVRPADRAAVALLPADGARLAFDTVADGGVSGVKRARNVLVRDQAAFNALWRAHAAGVSPPPPQPPVNFATHMLVGVFVGERTCSIAAIHRIGITRGRVVVDYRTREERAECTPGVWTPMHLALVERIDAPVEFNPVQFEHLQFSSLAQTRHSQMWGPKSLVVRDAQSWRALWREHTALPPVLDGAGASANLPAPPVDFRKNMVVAVFLGGRPGACHDAAIVDIVRAAGRIEVRSVQSSAGRRDPCTGTMSAPAHLVQLARSDEAVEFSSPLLSTN